MKTPVAKRREDESTYQSWLCMRRRCNDAGHQHFEHYGERGISICDRWSDYDNFFVDMGPRPEGLTLERDDNSKGYSPENCRWATHVEQCSNRRSNVVITWQGQTKTLKQWAEILGFPYKTMWARKKAGWSTERLLSEGLHYEKSF